jgi:hypothetical protein
MSGKRRRSLAEEMEEMGRLPVHPTIDTYPIRCGCCDKLFASPNRSSVFCEKCAPRVPQVRTN